METKKKAPKGLIAGLGIAMVGLLGVGVASAVALGIEANNELGAGTSVTATCQPVGDDIVVGFNTPAYVSASKSFSVDTVKLTNINADCDGLSVKVVVSEADGTSLAQQTGTVAGTSLNVVLPSAVDSAEVGNVSVVIWQD